MTDREVLVHRSIGARLLRWQNRHVIAVLSSAIFVGSLSGRSGPRWQMLSRPEVRCG
jgi:hypothetical protein